MSVGAAARRCDLTIEGELTIRNGAALREQLRTALAENDEVELNMAAVSEFDSAGLQLLIAAKKSAVAAGKTLRFTDSSRPMVDVLDLYGLLDELMGPRDGARP